MRYEGEENLEILKLAENYNSFLVNQVWEKCQKFAGTSQIVDFGSGARYLTALLEEKFGQEILCVEPAENLKKFYVNRWACESLSDLPDRQVFYIYFLNVLVYIKFYDSFVFPLSRLLDRLTGGKLLGKNLLLILEKKD